jgi:hypothetical protein
MQRGLHLVGRALSPWRIVAALALAAVILVAFQGSGQQAKAGDGPESPTLYYAVQAKKLSGPANRVDITFSRSSPDVPKVGEVFGVSASILKGQICFGVPIAVNSTPTTETWTLVFTEDLSNISKCVIGGEEILIAVTPIDPTNHPVILDATFYNDDDPVGPGNAKKIDWGKLPRFDNIWLCGDDVTSEFLLNCNGTLIATGIGQPVTTPDPKCAGFPNFNPPETCPRQEVGAFEFEVRFDAKFVDVELLPLPFSDPAEHECATIRGEGFIQLRCNTKGKANPIDAPNVLALLAVTPTPDVYSLLRANQENGIVTQLINQDCQLADLQGHPIPVEGLDVCQNGAVTLRYLEGDVHADCEVNVRDQQQVAFRWGSRLGQLLYNENFDLEPAAPKLGDGDIDAKDLQVVYGRHGSTCHDPHPDQPPVDPKAKVGPPLPE